MVFCCFISCCIVWPNPSTKASKVIALMSNFSQQLISWPSHCLKPAFKTLLSNSSPQAKFDPQCHFIWPARQFKITARAGRLMLSSTTKTANPRISPAGILACQSGQDIHSRILFGDLFILLILFSNMLSANEKSWCWNLNQKAEKNSISMFFSLV